MKVVRKLQDHLQKASKPETKKWFENYLRNVISYRGVKTPVIHKILDHWRIEEGLGASPLRKQFEIACHLIRQEKAEDKFAGIIYIQKYLYKEMGVKVLLRHFDRLYRENCFWDWCTTDWFCVRVLDPMIVFHGKFTAEIIANWRKKENFWQRRSSIISFRGVSREKKYHGLIKKVIADLIKEQDRFIQTAVGWTLSDLSKIYPEVAEKIVEKHFKFLLPEVIRRHTKHLPKHKVYKLSKNPIKTAI